VTPGYGGYRPSIAADTHIGKTITEQSREVYSPKMLDTAKNSFSSSGWNATLIPKTDNELAATNYKYGVTSIQRPSKSA
jgi:hypothetical protein